ncbi:MAG: thiamine-phosphate kinase [Muribaculaceae bacterium]|nr:thiamine-phosphate kinase [Muribaculaceae bacterium]
MKEKNFISIIKNTLNSRYIGDDCAYLDDLNIVVTQDSLVEDIHFSLDYMTPFQLGFKSVMVNISDVCASGAEIKYLTIALSLPKNIDENFIKEFYQGAKSACPKGVEIVGGDITGAEKIMVSVCAIGSAKGRKISSRKNAKPGYKIVVAGLHGSSAAGLELLQTGDLIITTLVNSHLQPVAQIEFTKQIGENIKTDYAMMDTSDGLMDALSAIANDSGVLLKIDFDKIPYESSLNHFNNPQELVLFGGEDYGIVAALPKEFECGGTVIGEVFEGLGVDLNIDNKVVHFSKKDVEEKIFNHF